jgi:DNA-binding protein YbaB
MFNKIKAIKDLRQQAKQMQNQLAGITIEGTFHGKVTVKMDGNQQILSVEIADELIGNKEKLEQAIKEAFQDVMKKMQKELASKMKDMGGLDALKNLGF